MIVGDVHVSNVGVGSDMSCPSTSTTEVKRKEKVSILDSTSKII